MFAQFTSNWIQNDKYWNDGKAEFNIFEAQEVRYGKPHASEVIHILVREPFSPNELVKTENGEQAGAYPVLKLNQIINVPTGIYVYQQMHTNFWRINDGRLIKFSFTSNDGCGNTFKLGKRNEENWLYYYHTYWEGMSEGEEKIIPPMEACFYDELPMRVRTIDFLKGATEFEIQLAPTMIHSKKGSQEFKLARVSFEVADKQILVNVTHVDGKDQFILDSKFPYLLRQWKKADGSELRLKQSLKIDYWNYNKPGDREKALGSPVQEIEAK